MSRRYAGLASASADCRRASLGTRSCHLLFSGNEMRQYTHVSFSLLSSIYLTFSAFFLRRIFYLCDCGNKEFAEMKSCTI